jgi:hypothetical protein
MRVRTLRTRAGDAYRTASRNSAAKTVTERRVPRIGHHSLVTRTAKARHGLAFRRVRGIGRVRLHADLTMPPQRVFGNDRQALS